MTQELYRNLFITPEIEEIEEKYLDILSDKVNKKMKGVKVKWEFGLQSRAYIFGKCYYFYIKAYYKNKIKIETYTGADNIVIDSKNQLASLEELIQMVENLDKPSLTYSMNQGNFEIPLLIKDN